MKKIGASLSLLLATPLLAFAPLASAATTVVKQADLAVPPSTTTKVNSWYFYNDNTGVASTAETLNYSFVSGPGAPPAGIGSLKFENTASTDRWTIATNQFSGVDLDAITALSFDMFVPASSAGGVTTTSYLNLDIDFDSTVSSGYKGRLVYVPQSVTADTWQTFSADSGLLSWSRFEKGFDNIAGNADDNQWPDGNTNPLRSLSDIKTVFPNAAVWNEGGFTGQLLIKSGHPGPTGLVNYIDKVVVNENIFDFEPTVTLENKDACKNEGWKTSTSPVFKNQGDCVSSFASKNKANGNPVANFFRSLTN